MRIKEPQMTWIITDASVSLTYSSITWEREQGGVKQTFTVMAWNDGTMTTHALSVWEGVTIARDLKEIKRDFIHLDVDITKYFNMTMFKGDK